MPKSTSSCVIIVNPTSGRERAARYIAPFHNVLSTKYEDIIIRLTRGQNDARLFAYEAAQTGRDVFCMGGDGTVNESINGIVSVNGSPSTFGFIPFGTVNDLARALHIPRTPPEAIRMMKSAVRKHVDVGRINQHYFINIVAAGLIPETVSQVTVKEKTLFGSLAYFLKGFQVLGKQPSYRFLIEEKDKPPLYVSSPLLAAMLTDSAGSFRNLVPPEERNQGVIKLALFHDFEWITTLKEAPKFFAGIQPSKELLTVISVKHARISVKDQKELTTNVDGDPGPSFPIELDILPGRLPVFVPAEEEPPLHIPDFLSLLAPHFKMWFPKESPPSLDDTSRPKSKRQP